jgi:hypothetical protein
MMQRCWLCPQRIKWTGPVICLGIQRSRNRNQSTGQLRLREIEVYREVSNASLQTLQCEQKALKSPRIPFVLGQFTLIHLVVHD